MIHVTKICEKCGTPYHIKRYRENTARFCSRHCKAVWIYENRLRAIFSDSKHKIGNKHRQGLRPTNAFPKGHAPWNQNVKGIHLSPSSEFVSGHKRTCPAPLGTEEIRTHRGVKRYWIKIAEPNKWMMRAVLIYEAHFGPLPEGSLVHHKDRKSLNDSPENLQDMTRAEHIREHRNDLFLSRQKSFQSRRGLLSSE